MSQGGFSKRELPRFNRELFESGESFARIGRGELGGKAAGLVFIRDVLREQIDAAGFPWVRLGIPAMVVVTTEIFDLFMARNDLSEIALSDSPDDRIAHAFQRAELPVEVVGDLKALIDQIHEPLALRSSSLLEDALYHPFAGVYATKMIPNNQPDPGIRFKRLAEAIKFVWASTYFRSAKSYIRAIQRSSSEEKMAVIVQEVVGRRHGERFYPDVSGVGRSYNFYPASRAKPEEGVVNLALGLGRTIVDGGLSWAYSPAHPKAPPPFGSVGELLKNTQTDFWAVNMGKPPEFDPISEDEHLCKADLAAAEYDGVLGSVASTYVASSDRLLAGGRRQRAPRAQLRSVARAPPVSAERPAAPPARSLRGGAGAGGGDRVRRHVSPRGFRCRASGLPPGAADGGLRGEGGACRGRTVGSRLAAGLRAHHGQRGCGHDPRHRLRQARSVRGAARTREIAAEIAEINAALMDEERPYLLIGFGRWGSSDSWLGIPVDWGQICGAKVIVEATLPDMNVEASQGAHFFHNITSFRVSYLTVHHAAQPGIDWDWLAALPAVRESGFVRQVRLARPLLVKVDGRAGRGAVWRRVEPPGAPARSEKGRQMKPKDELPDNSVESLQERAKELACLYAVDEILNRRKAPVEEICRALIEVIPPGWQYPEVCVARIKLDGREYAPAGFEETPWRQTAEIAIEGEVVGEVGGLLHRGEARGGRGTVPEGRAATDRGHRGPDRAVRAQAPPAARRRKSRPSATGGSGAPALGDHPGVPAPHRPAAARADHPQDDQLPLLVRREGAEASAAEDGAPGD